jgi:dihydropteroate synthase
MHLTLGRRTYDLSTRALVMGILNRTPDSFFDQGGYWDMDAFWRRAEQLVADGADVLDVGGVKAGPGPDVSEQEELDRVGPAVEGLCRRFDVAVSVDTWRAAVAEAAFGMGAVMGNDISGFSDPRYLGVAAAAGASVVATHIRLAPRVPDPEPSYRDVVADVIDVLVQKVDQARAAGVAEDRIVVDAGLDLGKTAEQSQALLLGTSRLASLGYPVLLSASNKRFLGDLLGLDIASRGHATSAAHAIGISLGARLLRAHDVRAARRVSDVLAAIFEAA